MHLKGGLLRVHSSGTERERGRPPASLADLRTGAGTDLDPDEDPNGRSVACL